MTTQKKTLSTETMIFGETMCELKFIGTIWLNCIKMVQIPLIVCILVTAVGKQSNLSTFGRVAVRILIYFAMTTISIYPLLTIRVKGKRVFPLPFDSFSHLSTTMQNTIEVISKNRAGTSRE